MKEVEELIKRLKELSAETVLVKPYGRKAEEIKLGDLEIERLWMHRGVALIPFKRRKGSLSIFIEDLAKITALPLESCY